MSDEPDRQSVARAMREFDRVGQEAFLSTYSGGRPPRGHYIEAEGKRYPLKALWAAAKNPRGLTRDFQTATARKGFIDLGFSPVYTQIKKRTATQNGSDVVRSARLARLESAQKIPGFRLIEVKAFDRNPDVIAEVLHLASGFCDACGDEAPFRRASSQEPYLEVHHKIPLAQGGEDTVANAVALCPNCHRRAHFG